MSNYISSVFKHEIAVRPRHIGFGQFDGTNANWLTDNAAFAWDSTAVTPTLDFIGGRPCLALTNSGSTATDGAQFQVTAASYQLQAAKKVHLWGGFRFTTVTQDIGAGWAAIDTSLLASEATDHAAWQKLAAATAPTIRMRKASGTAQASNRLNPTFAVDTWYDWEMVIIRDSATAGVGAVQLFMGSAVEPGGTIPNVFNGTFNSQVPDTVDLAPYFAWRAGSAANVSGYVSHFGWLIEG